MADLSLLLVCGVALAAVFVLLTALAAVMQLMTALLPVRTATAADAAVVAAISTVVAHRYPGARVTRIEEEDR